MSEENILMDLVCTKCNNNITMIDILGTINKPFCKECWEKEWKGKEEEFIFSIIHQLDTMDSSEPSEEILVTH